MNKKVTTIQIKTDSLITLSVNRFWLICEMVWLLQYIITCFHNQVMKQFLQSVIHFKSHRILISNKVKIKKKITYIFFVAEKEKSHSESQQTFEEVVKERDQVKWDALQSNCKKLIWKGSIWFVIGYKLYLVGCVFPISNESWWVVKKKKILFNNHKKFRGLL